MAVTLAIKEGWNATTSPRKREDRLNRLIEIVERTAPRIKDFALPQELFEQLYDESGLP